MELMEFMWFLEGLIEKIALTAGNSTRTTANYKEIKFFILCGGISVRDG